MRAWKEYLSPDFLHDVLNVLVIALLLVIAGKLWQVAGSKAATTFVSFIVLGYLLGRGAKFSKMTKLHDEIEEHYRHVVDLQDARIARLTEEAAARDVCVVCGTCLLPPSDPHCETCEVGYQEGQRYTDSESEGA